MEYKFADDPSYFNGWLRVNALIIKTSKQNKDILS